MNMGNNTFDHSTLIINSRTSVVFCEISAGKRSMFEYQIRRQKSTDNEKHLTAGETARALGIPTLEGSLQRMQADMNFGPCKTKMITAKGTSPVPRI